MRIKVTPTKIRIFAVAMILPFGVLGAIALTYPIAKTSLAQGPIQHGHEGVQCNGCHKRTDATLRQQIQANIRYAVGYRQELVDFGYLPVTTSECLDCHARPNERHPIYRFREPRFGEAIEVIKATTCLGCHSEHANQRSFAPVDFCQECHDDLKLKNDPVDVPHAILVKDQNWGSCLGCHDFHGNHEFKTPKLLVDAAPEKEILEYLAASDSPYGKGKFYKADVK